MILLCDLIQALLLMAVVKTLCSFWILKFMHQNESKCSLLVHEMIIYVQVRLVVFS